MTRTIVTFLSDFGTMDGYVSAVKGVILSAAPEATIVDVTHDVRPQAIAEGVLVAEQAWPHYPAGVVHLAVVDPGVGTSRAAIALLTPDGFAVGPDNGVLSAAMPPSLRHSLAARWRADVRSVHAVSPPDGYQVREIVSPKIVAGRPSATFHGRDVFAPAAGHLAAGGDFERLGPVRPVLLVLPAFRGRQQGDAVTGEVVHVDRFGNLISSIRGEQLPAGATRAAIAGRNVPIVRTYGDGRGIVALIGSAGYLEVAEVNGNAAVTLNAGPGEPVTVRAP